MNVPKRMITDRSLNLTLMAILILAGVMGRLMPHAPNATPVVGLGLLAGAAFGARTGIFLPIAVLAATDLILGTYAPLVMISVYGCLTLPALAGSRWLRNRRRPVVIAASAAGCSIVFFLVTNFAVWVSGGWYGRDLQGLIECYVAALPFLRNMITADLIWSGVLFSALSLLESRRIAVAALVDESPGR